MTPENVIGTFIVVGPFYPSMASHSFAGLLFVPLGGIFLSVNTGIVEVCGTLDFCLKSVRLEFVMTTSPSAKPLWLLTALAPPRNAR